MHELSIALSIIEGAAAAAAQHGGQVAAVHLRLGPLAGVVKEALLFSYELACADTALAGSRLLIEETSLIVFCPQCKAERALAAPPVLCCPVCGALTPEVVQGRELELFALELAS